MSKSEADTGTIPENIYRAKDLPSLTGYSIPHLWDLVAAGKFPKPIPLGARAVGWRSSEIAAWQRERIAARDARDE